MIVAGMMVLILGTDRHALADAPQRTVLILASEDSLLPAIRILTDSIVAPLRRTIPANLTIFTEFMDVSRRQNEDASREIVQTLSAKYANKKIDVIFALGPQALQFLVEQRDTLLPSVPVVFAGIGKSNPLLDKLPDRIGGVTTEFEFSKTLDLAVALQPGLQHIVLVTGASDFDRTWRDRALGELKRYPRQLSVEDVAALPLDDALDKLGGQQPNSAVFYLTMFKDGNGSTFVPTDLATRIATAANAPVYGVYPTFLGKGIVGGYISTFESSGTAAAELALPILLGEDAPDGLSILNSTAQYQVDARAMRRWGLEQSLLPAGTVVHFGEPSLIAAYWPTIALALAVIAAQAIVIVAFWRQKRRRQDAELSLRQFNEHIEVAATAANLGLWSWSPAQDHIWMTPHCRRMLSVEDRVEVDLDTFLRSLAGQKQSAAKLSLIESLKTGGLFQGEFCTADSSGQELWLSATGNRIRHGHDMLIAGTLLDISERKMAQIDAEQQRRQIIHLTRVAVLGELSGSLAHELNQPLTAILSNAQTAQRLIARSSPNIAELQEILADIVEDDHRAGAVLGNLRSLIRKEDAQYVELDLNQIVDDVLHLVHSDLIERQIQVRTELSDSLPRTRGDRVQIQQVLINLVRNACDAMSAEPGQSHRLVLSTDRTGNGGLAVTVADNGGGIPENLLDRLFEPFVTTKAQGLGLGLTISRSILSAHGGRIWCENNAGGAVFGFSLPASERRVAWAS